jgi:hypothetical protein
MAINPPYRLDPLQNIVDVKWSSETFGLSWHFDRGGASSEAFDCPLGGGAITHSAILFDLTLVPPVSSVYSISGSPSVTPAALSWVSGEFSSVAFAPDSKHGTESGGGEFIVLGVPCFTAGVAEAGAITLIVPAITATNIETSQVFEMVEWSAVAAAGINFSARFEPGSESA